MCLKSLYTEAFEKNLCSGDAIMPLQESVFIIYQCLTVFSFYLKFQASFDFDFIEKPLNSWEVITSFFYSGDSISTIFNYKDSPLIGGKDLPIIYL